MAVDVASYSARLGRLFERTAGRIEPGLERTRRLMDWVGNPDRQFRSFHIAGTNGKGSTVASLDALLRAGNRRVGRYTSPHLVDFRERIAVDGEPIRAGDVVALLDRIEPEAERIDATFFEITTVLALCYFKEARVDVAVIETGLGGRLDSTNVIDPIVAAVTNIALDHTEHLGHTLQEIADEKAGIFKPGRPAVIGEPGAEIARRLGERAAELGAEPIVSVRDDWRGWSTKRTGAVTSFTAQTPRGRFRVSTPLLGDHQMRNTLTALATLSAAGDEFWLPPARMHAALAAVRLPGRFQRNGDWIFDVAHNPAGAVALAETLTARRTLGPITVVLGVLLDKDWQDVIGALAGVADGFIITQPPSAPTDRLWDPIAAAAHASSFKVWVSLEPDFGAAIERARSSPGTKVVTGSFHTVGDAMRLLGIDPLVEVGSPVAGARRNR